MDQDFVKSIAVSALSKRVYNKCVLKWRIEPNGSIILSTSFPVIDLFFLNQRASSVFLLLDGRRIILEIIDYLASYNGIANRDDIESDVIKTIRYLE